MTRHSPKPLGDPVVHYWLAQSVAKVAGIDLAAEMAAGRLTQENWVGMVERCRGCDWERTDGACSRWLALRQPGTAEPPAACENSDVFAALKGGG